MGKRNIQYKIKWRTEVPEKKKQGLLLKFSYHLKRDL